jgi:hypothetical protein
MPHTHETTGEGRRQAGDRSGEPEDVRGLRLGRDPDPRPRVQAGSRHGQGPMRAPGPCDDGLRHAYGPRW